jgi:cytoplasmic iron level regulating protein YaaA (DUF328/UPF0246 family)
MIALISPSKDLNYKSEFPVASKDLPRLFDQSKIILEVIKKKKVKDLMKLMDISTKLAEENVRRYEVFSESFTKENSRPAVFAFAGDVYRGLEAYTLNKVQLNYCQKHLRILSGLYGLLRPYDLIQPYRLEMGIPLKVNKHKDIYSFWGSTITELLQKDIEESKSKHLINLASQEYFEAIKVKELKVPVINIHFREYKNNKLSFVSYTAKKARGLMAKYMALENLKSADELKGFNLENYQHDSGLSSAADWYFIR